MWGYAIIICTTEKFRLILTGSLQHNIIRFYNWHIFKSIVYYIIYRWKGHCVTSVRVVMRQLEKCQRIWNAAKKLSMEYGQHRPVGSSWWRVCWPPSWRAGGPSWLPGSPPPDPHHSVAWSALGWLGSLGQHHPREGEKGGTISTNNDYLDTYASRKYWLVRRPRWLTSDISVQVRDRLWMRFPCWGLKWKLSM